MFDLNLCLTVVLCGTAEQIQTGIVRFDRALPGLTVTQSTGFWQGESETNVLLSHWDRTDRPAVVQTWLRLAHEYGEYASQQAVFVTVQGPATGAWVLGTSDLAAWETAFQELQHVACPGLALAEYFTRENELIERLF